MTDRIRNFRVGIVGGSQSGKTLYLSCLPRFIEIDKRLRSWQVSFQGADDKSIDWLSDSRESLNKGDLPVATLKNVELNFLLICNNSRGAIRVIDRKGGAFEDKKNLEEPDLINHLSSCTGFVVLIDPLKSLQEQSAYYRPLFEKLYIKNNTASKKRFSICLTKYDNPIFFSWYADNLNQFNNIPKREERDCYIYKKWFTRNGDVEDFSESLKMKFGGENFQHYLISSIGFYKPNNTTISTNLAILLSDEGLTMGRLRNGSEYSPVNLFDPLFWAVGGNRSIYD